MTTSALASLLFDNNEYNFLLGLGFIAFFVKGIQNLYYDLNEQDAKLEGMWLNVRVYGFELKPRAQLLTNGV